MRSSGDISAIVFPVRVRCPVGKAATRRSGKNVTITRGRKTVVFGSYVRPTSVTSPTCRPKRVTGAPADNPRTDSLK